MDGEGRDGKDGVSEARDRDGKVWDGKVWDRESLVDDHWNGECRDGGGGWGGGVGDDWMESVRMTSYKYKDGKGMDGDD